MKKSYLFVLMVLIFSMSFSIAAYAEIFDYAIEGYDPPLIVDDADVLSDNEEETLTELANEVSDEYECDVAVVTVETIGNKSVEAYTDDFFDYGGYGYGNTEDGIMLLIDMGGREWHITTTGYAIEAFSDAGLAYIEEQFIDYLSDGDYYYAFDEFISVCDEFLAQAETGEPFDTRSLPREPLSLMWIPGSVIIGFIVALIVVGVMKSQLKSVRSQPAANSYVKQNSMKITTQRDLFLYRTVSKRAKPKDTGSSGGSSSHRSSSGSSHGGRSGRF